MENQQENQNSVEHETEQLLKTEYDKLKIKAKQVAGDMNKRLNIWEAKRKELEDDGLDFNQFRTDYLYECLEGFCLMGYHCGAKNG